MLELIGLVATGAVSIWGYVQSRRHVRGRLRFVDAVQKPITPVVAEGETEPKRPIITQPARAQMKPTSM